MGITDVPTGAAEDPDTVSFSVIVLRNLFRQRVRTLLTVLGIGVGRATQRPAPASTSTSQGNGVGWRPVAHGVDAAPAKRPRLRHGGVR